MAPQTLCPACGHSPIPPGAEECPVCQEPFSFLPTYKKAKNRFLDPDDVKESESTVFGGHIESAVTAHPWQGSVLLFAGAAIWFLRAAGLFTEAEPPFWLYALVLANLLVGLLLVVNLGPSRLLAQGAFVAQLGAALYLGREDLLSPVHGAYAAHAVVGLAAVVGEPSAGRRAVTLLLGLVAAGAAVGLLFLDGQGKAAVAGPRQELRSAGFGYRLTLPVGWSHANPGELSRDLRTPAGGSSVGFANGALRTVGLLFVKRDAEAQAIAGCASLHHALGGTHEARPLPERPPQALAPDAVVYELRTFSGATGKLSCGKLADGRFAALAVVGVVPGTDVGARVFEEVGAGLSLK